MKIIQEITQEVETFIRYNSIKTDKGYKVDKHIFTETLVDIRETTYNNEQYQSFNFLNKRINTKFYQVYHTLKEHTTLEDLFSNTVVKILEYIEDKPHIIINYDNYRSVPDDISNIVFLIDKEVHRETLEYAGYEYNRQQADKESAKYFAKYGNDLIWIDEIDEDFNEQQDISQDDVLQQYSNTEEDYMQVNKLIKEAKLTKRQEEVLEVLMYSDFNITHTAEQLGVSRPTVSKMFNNIKERFIASMEGEQVMESTDTLSEAVEGDLRSLKAYLIENIDNPSISPYIYFKEGAGLRREFIRCYKGKDYNPILLERYLIKFKENYHKQVK